MFLKSLSCRLSEAHKVIRRVEPGPAVRHSDALAGSHPMSRTRSAEPARHGRRIHK